ncbi:MAG: hypothetical protein ABSA86_14320 [Oryzomonas sp.]|jgi:hypothetical protein
MQRHLLPFTLAILLYICSPALAWNDATHMAVMKAAGLDDYAYLAVGADMSKAKSGGHEECNHYRNNAKGVKVTADMVLDQVRDYDSRCNDKGHLYGAIIAALTQYREYKNNGRYARYPLGFAAHYIGDLSMPLHNTDYNDFNKAYHRANDGVVEGGEDEATDAKVARITAEIRKRMARRPAYQLPRANDDVMKFNRELAKKIAEIANKSIALGYAMQDAKPQKTIMSADDAFGQLAESAALLKAAFAALQ